MKNLFDSDNYSDSVPAELVAGTVFAWKRSDITAVYPVASYTLKFRLAALASPFAEYEYTAEKGGGEHVITETSTDDVTAGEYRWHAVVTRDSDSAEVQVDEGLLTIRAAAGQDDGHTYRTLMAIRATIEGTASVEQSRIEVGGRVLENRTIEDLLKLEKEYRKRWRAEKARLERQAGRSGKSRVLVKMEA